MPEYIKNICKTYNDHVKIIEYKRPWIPQKGKKSTKMKTITTKRLKLLRSSLRSQQTIQDIILCNKFQYFVTLTISPKTKIDRFSYSKTSEKISKWLNNHLTHYILVPEKHKSGAYHFHLLADIEKSKLHYHNFGVYSIKPYKLGYSHVTKIKDQKKTAKYITKYITKDLVNSVGQGKKTYWASRDLKRPKKEYNVDHPDNSIHLHAGDYLDIYNAPLNNKKHRL